MNAMRSIQAKILTWTLGTFAASLAAFAAISHYAVTASPGPGDFFAGTFAMIDGEAVRSFEQGGAAGLADLLGRLDRYHAARHFLIDADGRDLVNGEDRSPLLARVPLTDRPTRLGGGEIAFAREVGRGRYRLVVLLADRFDPLGLLPYFGAVVLAIGGLGYALAVHLASPLRRLRRVVDRFAAGDLDARSGSRQRDEIGELSRAFDAMASQIQTLRAAELRLLQNVSHELRSPLARLGFNLELARGEGDREVPLARIEKDLGRLSRLVAELLELTCAEGVPGSRRREVVRLADLLGSLVEDCSAEADAKGCRLASKVAGNASLVGDPELLRRGAENVLRNAIRHAPAGSAIDVDLSEAGGTATITVRDRGPGVPTPALGAIFEPFFRVGDDRSRVDGGVGLGLSIARRAIELHRGRIAARNAEPGLSVAIELPANPLEAQAEGRRHGSIDEINHENL